MVSAEVRAAWPEQVLTGTYHFRTRRRDQFNVGVDEVVWRATDGLVRRRSPEQLLLWAGGRPLMAVMRESGKYWSGLPEGPLLYNLAPAGATLIVAHRKQHHYDVLDNRLGLVVGRLEIANGPFGRARTRILDPSGDEVALMEETRLSSVADHLENADLLSRSWTRRRFHFTVDGERVAHIKQRYSMWRAVKFEFDVRRLRGRVDPRLILACGVEELSRYSTY
ncbi:hypothetical protein KOI35_28775 [Actinoplanes bogorensis]|uniref:Uncharacterized protein n=1 Tax=Paractinoplanes bogorensis TaxID=1610840 RepID=A0ABS5YVN2_9ACTN|nr:hypothetical protein [Actinoplanes bogorensis]MBU2667514.1 hypothetical protein [Actinoplanes bogorensis]